jgi:hypothetical protein
MRSSVVLRGATGGLVAALIIAAPAAAFELNGGCTLTIASTDAAGGALDAASGSPDGGEGGTQPDPFLIDWNGTVTWNAGSEGQAFMDHAWGINVFLIPTPVRGGDPNAGGDTTGEGTVDVSANAPFRTTGLYHVSGAIDGAGGTRCDGSGWFKLTGDPVGTIPFWIAVLIILLGIVTLWTARPHRLIGGA